MVDVVVRGVFVAALVTKTTMNGVNVAAAVHENSSTVPPVTIPIALAISYAKPFSNISKFEVFNGHNFKRWQERIFSILDMHGVAFALINPHQKATQMPSC